MRGSAFAALAALLLAACAKDAPPPSGSVADAVATPFYVAFKIPACIGTVAIAAPLGGLAALAPGDDARDFQGQIDRSLAANCGPPYALAH